MATSLILSLNTNNGDKTLTVQNVDPEVGSSNVNDFISALVTNSANALKFTVTGASKAVLRTTTDTEVNLS